MKRNIGQELLDGIEVIKSGEGGRHAVELPDDAKDGQGKDGIEPASLCRCPGGQRANLQEWEQGRRKP